MVLRVVSTIACPIITYWVCYLVLNYISVREKKEELSNNSVPDLPINYVIRLEGKKIETIVSIILSLFGLVIALLSYDRTTSILNFFRVVFIFLTACSIGLTDIRLRIIPNLFVLITIFGGTAFHIIDTIWFSSGDISEKIKSILIFNVASSVIVLLVLCILSAITHQGMGFGDIKFLFALCYAGGISLLLVSLSTALIGSLIVGLVLLAKKKKEKKDTLPFGPFITAGVILSIMLGLM